ncbi:glycosyltransferase family 2 protein [Duncaniella freteri]|jgi:Glycosyltransferases involved in cell wall biogenesis|uniref:glycosyltransferase family 2 protein n=1 Tax=Duncaniella freteri TaxID=2530391 RepID=UPI000FFE53A6|nr:glycosyltransferase family 2 protein [Duncaniella freteri]RXE73238.1 glycosyltransferase family 2 protein [Muribaculaceae bacterium Isolate-013 (NCI)]
MIPFKISVIIPVYKAEKFISRCAESLFSQSLDGIEFIFVDDCTPDNSIEILKSVAGRYENSDNRIKIVRMPVNSKQAAARNEGLKHATGEYIIHCDPDDWVDNDLYEKMYHAAKDNDYDIVTCGYMEHLKDGKREKSSLLTFEKPFEPIQSDRFFFPALWRHLIKRQLIAENDITFYPDVNFMEDFGFVCRALYHAKSVGHVHSSFYHYNKTNDDSITTRINSPSVVKQRIECLNRLDAFFERHGISKSVLGLLLRSKRDIKDLFLNKSDLKKWCTLFPEVARWEFHYSQASFAYRLAYLLSHHIGLWPMRMLLALKK